LNSQSKAFVKGAIYEMARAAIKGLPLTKAKRTKKIDILNKAKPSQILHIYDLFACNPQQATTRKWLLARSQPTNKWLSQKQTRLLKDTWHCIQLQADAPAR
jgi:hypothetical protein